MSPRFNTGDVVTIPGAQGVWTIASWPATNEGNFVVEQFNAEGNVAVRNTLWYGETEDGEPLAVAIVPLLAATATFVPEAPILTSVVETAEPVVEDAPDLPESDPADADVAS